MPGVNALGQGVAEVIVIGPLGVGAAIAGDVAHDGIDSGNPVKIGGRAASTPPASVAAGDRVNLWLGTSGQTMIGAVSMTGTDVQTNALCAIPSGVGGMQLLATANQVFNGVSWERPRTPVIFRNVAAVAVTAGTPVTVWTPAAGKRVRLMGFALSLSVAGSVILKTATVESIRTPLVAAGTGHTSSDMGNGILYAADAVFQVDATATGAVSGYVFGTEE